MVVAVALLGLLVLALLAPERF
ncbi:potassium-transporting ATPase subunit F, partial [Streptomyces sp. NPDC002734]